MEFRTIDGSGNNLAQPTLNAAGTDFTRIGPAHFADGIHAPPSGPNARMISNVVVGDGDAEAPGPEGLSALMFAWGQFIDHDLDLNRPDGVNHIDIVIPADDAVFPPGSVIPVTRAIIDPATGQDAAHPAIQVNSITGWLDASMVYGSDAATAASLRLPDGHLKTSAGNNLPIVNGAFAAGDVRVNENPALASLHTLFMREHNHQVDLLHKQHPGWSGEQLYQHARAIVIAEIEHITFEEFLPHLIGPNALSDYQGYDDSVDPRITAQFAGAAFRFGHSIVTPQLSKVGEQGQVLEVSDLQDVFFAPPAAFAANGGAAAVLRGLVDDASPAPCSARPSRRSSRCSSGISATAIVSGTRTASSTPRRCSASSIPRSATSSSATPASSMSRTTPSSITIAMAGRNRASAPRTRTRASW